MKIAIVYLPYDVVENQPNIKPVADNYGIFPPLTLLQVASIVMKYGQKVKFIDAIAKNYSINEIIKEIREYSPNLVMYTITTYLFHQTRKIINKIKSNTNVPVVIGGAHMSIFPKETMEYKEFDYGIIGEAETTLKEFLEIYDKYKSKSQDEIKKHLKETSGICFKLGKRTIINPAQIKLNDINKAPFPARFLIDNTKYYTIISQKKNYTAIITSRGCPYKCIFCEQKSKSTHARSPENVLAEIKGAYDKYNIREFEFFDPTFTLNKQRAIKICKLIINSKIKIIYSIRTRADKIDDETSYWLKKSGCIRVYLGIESSNQKILDFIKKSIDKEKIKSAVKSLKKNKIKVFGYFIFGLPYDTEKTIKETIKFARSLKLDFVQFSELSILPNTELYNMYVKDVLQKDYWREYIKNEKSSKILNKYKCKLSDSKIQSLISKAYLYYYLHPANIIRTINTIKSLSQFKRYLKAALSMMKFKIESLIK